MKSIKQYLRRHPVRSRRMLEILPGAVSWFLILFPVWGSLVIPEVVAVYIIAFTVFWLYKSLSVAVLALVAHFRIEASKRFDWMGEVTMFPNWEKVQHILIIPTYQEPIKLLQRTLRSLTRQTFPLRRTHVVVTFEKREGKSAREKAKQLKKEFEDKFGTFTITFHPDLPGEVKGKSSNSAWAANEVIEKKLLREGIVSEDYTTVSSQDADAILHPNYLAALTYKFLDHPRRHQRFWQGAIMFYNNIWRIPAPVRTLVTMSGIVHLYLLVRRDRLINFSTYSVSLKLLRSVGYWDADVIPEDYRIFFKTFFATGGKVEVDPIFLPVTIDAAESTSYLKTLKNKYQQVKRWAWGVSDDQYVVRNAILAEGIPFWEKTLRVLRIVEDHFLWPVNWFAITIGALLPPLLNPEFSRTVIGKTLPQVSSSILTFSLVTILVVLFIDARQRPKRPAQVSLFRRLIQPLEMFWLPVVGFFLNALPGLDAHTRLMLGKYIEYRVTEKVEPN